MASLALAFDILARDRASHTLDKVGRSSDGLGKKLGGLGKVGLLALGGAAAGGVAALGASMVQGVKDAASYQKLAAKTAAVLKSTGNVAHQSVKGIQARAGALESLSGVDEEVIINGQNVLATFTKVRDGVGKGNDIFNQATTAALNMSSALGTDMQGSVIQLGKALNDPIKGITALSRAGVSFTAQQKEQIKTLVKSGNTLGAQKIILKELNTEFGGAAKAAGQGFEGSMARAKDAVQDAFRAIGTELLPVLTKVADYVAKNAGPAIQHLRDGFHGLFDLLVKGDFTKAFRDAFHLEEDSKVVDFLFRLREGFIAVTNFIRDKVIPVVTAYAGWLKNDLWPAIQKGYETIMPALRQALTILGGAFKGSGEGGANFKKVLETVGNIIVNYVIPILANIIKVWLPLWATQIRVTIEGVKLLWRVLQTLGSIVARVISFVIGKFADLASMAAGVFRALSHVPGFGWAKDAADKMERAAGKGRDLQRALDNITRNITIGVQFKATAGRIQVGNQSINVGMRAGGGPVAAGAVYAVGDNPDGSWNPTTELFVPKVAGHVYNQQQLATMGVGSASSGGPPDLSESTIQRIVAAFASVTLRPTISAGSVDAAMGGTLR